MASKRRRGAYSLNSRQRRLMSDLMRPNSASTARMMQTRRIRRGFEKLLAEPPEELADSELSDWERQQAIARERTRREGLT